MLSSSAAETKLEMGEPPFEIAINMGIHQFEHRIEKSGYATIVFKKGLYLRVETAKMSILLITAGVVDRTAIENIAATIAAVVLGQSFLE